MENANYLNREIELKWVKNKWVILILKISAYMVLAGLLLSISWNAWPDLIRDFGIELYTSWRLTQGDILYHDVTDYHDGPLSPYWNALLFYFFGTSIHTLVIANLVILGLLIFLLEDWLTAISDRFSATVAVLLFLAIFAFGRYTGIGNYNYVTPYLHSVVHGLILLLAMIVSIRRWEDTGRLRWLWISGLFFGLTLLTKIEIGISAVATIGTYFVFALLAKKHSLKDTGKKMALFFAAGAMPLIVTISIFAAFIPLREAVLSVTAPWSIIGDERLSRINNILFYKTGLGTDNIAGNILKLASWSWIYVNIILIGIFLVLVLKNVKHWQLLIATLIILATLAFGYFLAPRPSWLELARPLPLVMLVGFIFSVQQIVKQKNTLADNFKWPLRLISFVFAGTMLLKMILNTRLYHYGFILAMPATMLLVIILIGWLPKYLNRYGAGWAFKALGLGILSVLILVYMQISQSVYANNDFVCCNIKTIRDGDVIRTNSLQGPIIAGALNELDRRLKPGQTFAVIPEGLMMNYLLRRQNPTPNIYLLLDLLITDDEQNIINSFAKNPPDFIVLMKLNVTEFGFSLFGKDLGADLYKWVTDNYRTVWLEGEHPSQPGTKFGIVITEYIGHKK